MDPRGSMELLEDITEMFLKLLAAFYWLPKYDFINNFTGVARKRIP